MEYRKSYLANFVLYCENENALEEKIKTSLPYINLEIAKRKWNKSKKDSEARRRYELNSPGVKEFLENVPFVHYTGIDSLVGILQSKALLSVKEMERLDISFNYRIPSQGINDQMHRYVFAYPYNGDWLYGTCRIIFKKEISALERAFFMSRGWTTIPEHLLNDHIYSLGDWLLYMTEELTLSFSDPLEYFRTVPVYDRPEILFEDKVPSEYIDKIIVKGRPAFVEACSRIMAEIEDAATILSMIECEEVGGLG